MAGQIVVSSIKTDSDNSISFLANTGATIFSANLASGLSASSFGNNTITSDKIVSVANTKISGNITNDQILSVANTKITGNITSSQIAPSQTFYGNTSLTGLLDLSATNAGQIKFPATQNASSDANTLDDYEEGDWTAVLEGSTSNPSGTYSTQTGKYTKIGRTVFVAFQIVLNSGFSAGSGSIRISGLPFTSNFEVFGGNFCQEFNSNSYVLNHASMHIGNSVAYMDMFFNRQNDGFTNYKWADISTGNTMYLYGSMTYQVA
jgi:hypothetical protein